MCSSPVTPITPIAVSYTHLNEVWNIVVAYINKNKQFLSTTGIKYNAKVINDSIEYKGGKEGSNRATEGESISKNQFISCLLYTSRCV